MQRARVNPRWLVPAGLAALLLCVAASPAVHAQGTPVFQIKPAVPGDIPKIRANGQLEDAGGLLGDTGGGRGVNPFSILDAGGQGLSFNTAPSGGAYNDLRIGHDGKDGLISVNARGGAALGGLKCQINDGPKTDCFGGGTLTQINVSANNGITLTPNPITTTGTVGCTAASSSAFGCVPASGGGTTNYLRADLTWAPPPGVGTVTSVGLSVPGSSIFGVTGSPVTGSGTLGLTTTVTSGGILYGSSSTQVASSAALTANLPVFGGGAGVAPFSGTRTGNTTLVATSTGAQTSGACVSIDANGNHIAASDACLVGAIPLAIGWIASNDPDKAPIANINVAGTIVAIVGSVETPVGAAATITVRKAGSGTPCESGTALHSGTFNGNGTAATNQTLTVTVSSISAGDRICLDASDNANWVAGAGIGGITVFYRPT